MKKVKVIRCFLIRGEAQAPGTVVEVGDGLAAELVQNGKAELAGDKPAAKRGPMTTTSAPALAGKVESEEKE
jgi:hypothetical protein